MKLYSSQPTPRSAPLPPKRGWFMRRLRSRLFSTRTAWWVFVVIVAAFAISVFLMLRHTMEAMLKMQ